MPNVRPSRGAHTSIARVASLASLASLASSAASVAWIALLVSLELLAPLAFAPPASAADRWGEGGWGEMLWGGGGAALPALGEREVLALAVLLLTTGTLLARRLLKRRTGEER